MVEAVKRLPPELEPSTFAEEWKLPVLHESKVCNIPSRTCERVAAHVAEHPGFAVREQLRLERLRDNAGIEPLHTRPVGWIVVCALVNLQCADRIALDAGGRPGAVPVHTAINIDRLAGEEGGNATDLPASQCSTDEAVPRVLEEGQVVDVTGIEHLRPVEIRRGVPAGQKGVVHAVGARTVSAGRMVEAVGPSVCDHGRQPVAEGVAEFSLERVVARNGRVLLHADTAVAPVGLEPDRRPCLVDQELLSVAIALRITVILACKLRNVDDAKPERDFRQVAEPRQMPAHASHIRQAEQAVVANLALEAEAVLLLAWPFLAVRPGGVAGGWNWR